jgi:hypothetical protein
MKSLARMTAGELAAFVATHLAQHGIPVVLSGGACVTIYSKGRYVSADLDLIGNGLTPRSQLRKALTEIGFIEKGRQFWNDETTFYLDCAQGPVAIGLAPPKEVRHLKFSTGELPLLSPTDCVKDRLAAYYHWKDGQSLDQAALVAEGHRIDMEELRRWSQREGFGQEFELIKDRLAKRKRRKR